MGKYTKFCSVLTGISSAKENADTVHWWAVAQVGKKVVSSLSPQRRSLFWINKQLTYKKDFSIPNNPPPLKTSYSPCKNHLQCHRRILDHNVFLIQDCSSKSGFMEIFLVNFVCLHPKKATWNNTQNCPRSRASNSGMALFPDQAYNTGFLLLVSSPRRGGVRIHHKWIFAMSLFLPLTIEVTKFPQTPSAWNAFPSLQSCCCPNGTQLSKGLLWPPSVN